MQNFVAFSEYMNFNSNILTIWIPRRTKIWSIKLIKPSAFQTSRVIQKVKELFLVKPGNFLLQKPTALDYIISQELLPPKCFDVTPHGIISQIWYMWESIDKRTDVWSCIYTQIFSPKKLVFPLQKKLLNFFLTFCLPLIF